MEFHELELGEHELGEHELGEHEVVHELAEHEANAELMANYAAFSESEHEAEALAGAAATITLSPRDRRALRRLVPNLVRGAAILTRILRMRRATRPFVPVVPTIIRRTVRTLRRSAAAGRPITRRRAGAVMARQTRRVLSSPRYCGRQYNPFPLIQLPYHRMVNPWTLGAVLHEVSHNTQSDLGLSRAVPLAIARTLLRAGFGNKVARVWVRWNRETFADLCGLLLGGPCVVASLMDVVGRSPQITYHFNPNGVHPTPYLRVLISIELLRRMGFQAEAEKYARAWTTLYPVRRSRGYQRRSCSQRHEPSRL